MLSNPKQIISLNNLTFKSFILAYHHTPKIQPSTTKDKISP